MGLRKRVSVKQLGWVTIYLLLLGVVIVGVTVFLNAKDRQSLEENTDSPMDCVEVLTPAVNDQTGELRDFPTPCDVPAGWTLLKTADDSDTKSGQYAYIKRMYRDEGVSYIEIDPVNWYEGDDATRQLRADDPDCEKMYGPGCVIPEGYYINNEDKTVTRYRISDSASVTMQTLEKDEAGRPKFEQRITVEKLLEVFSRPSEEEMHFRITPFIIDIREGVVTRVLEQYVQ